MNGKTKVWARLDGKRMTLRAETLDVGIARIAVIDYFRKNNLSYGVILILVPRIQ